MDRIEKQVTLDAPRQQVWRAVADSHEFGNWFQATFSGPFTEGTTVRAHITEPGYEHLTLEMLIDKIHPQEFFTFSWHPYAIDPDVDYSREPMTQVEFRLIPREEGTELTISESGFDQLPEERRAVAYRMNEKGWTTQLERIEAHVSQMQPSPA